MKILVTGAAGFIGSTFVDFALSKGCEVVGVDNFETGLREFLSSALENERFQFIECDIRNESELKKAFSASSADWIVHFAANADVRHGTEQPRRDLDFNTTGTLNVLEAARLAGTTRILFSSTGSVYGEPEIFPTPENCPFPVQTSLYAASKLAGEALISSYCVGFAFTALVYRFVSIMGPRYTHGHVFDFMKSLRSDPTKLRVLGDGKQCKSYLHIEDLMDGLWLGIQSAVDKEFQIYNIGHEDTLLVDQSIGFIAERLGIKPELEHTGGKRGWIGDSPRIQLDASKLKLLGWAPKHSLRKAVEDTVDYLKEHPSLFEART